MSSTIFTVTVHCTCNYHTSPQLTASKAEVLLARHISYIMDVTIMYNMDIVSVTRVLLCSILYFVTTDSSFLHRL